MVCDLCMNDKHETPSIPCVAADSVSVPGRPGAFSFIPMCQSTRVFEVLFHPEELDQKHGS